ncbi:MAG: hypothetical protein AAFN92_04350, partial [Bacteroidota bacterium]
MKPLFFIVLCLLSSFVSAQLVRGDRIVSYQSNFNGGALGPSPNLVAGNHFQLQAFPEFEAGLLSGFVDYRYAFTDHLLAGLAFGGAAGIGQGAGGGIFLAPNVRFYLTEGQVSSFYLQLSGGGTLATGDGGAAFLQPAIGWQTELTPQILFAPQISYSIEDGPNSIILGADLEFRLGARERPTEPIIPVFERGDWLFGTDLIGFQFQDRNTRVGFRPVAYRFLKDRLALGAGFGFAHSRTDIRGFTPGGGSFVLSTTTIDFDVRIRRYFTTGRRFNYFSELGA